MVLQAVLFRWLNLLAWLYMMYQKSAFRVCSPLGRHFSSFIGYSFTVFCLFVCFEERTGQEGRGQQPHLPSLALHPYPARAALGSAVLRVCLVSLLRRGRGAPEIGSIFSWPYKYLHCCGCKNKFAWAPLCVVNFGLPTSHHLCCCVFIKTSITRLCPAQWEAILFLIAFLKQTKKGEKKKNSLKCPVRNHSWFKISHVRKLRCSDTHKKRQLHWKKPVC